MVPLEFLTSEELEKLKQFMEITNIEDDDTAHGLLVDMQWDLERALETFFLVGAESSGPAVGFTGYQLDPVEGPNNLAAGNNVGDAGAGNNESEEIIEEEERECSTPVDPLVPFQEQSVSEAGVLFAKNFERRYCSDSISAAVMPSFFTNELNIAIDAAFNQDDGKPLLFFFNNEHGKQTENFIRNGLCNDFICDLVRNNFILFPWDVTENDNLHYFLQLLMEVNMKTVHDQLFHFYRRGPEAFPLMFIISPQRNQYHIIGTITGTCDVDEMCNVLHEGFQQFKIDHAACIQERKRRKEDRELLDKQNREYEKSRLADLHREEEKKRQVHVNNRAMQEKKRREEENMHRAQMAARKVPAEPDQNDPDIITVKFRLPENRQETRLFRKSDKLESLIDFLESKRFFRYDYDFLNSDFPKKNITQFYDSQKTFEQVNWPSKETVYVDLKS